MNRKDWLQEKRDQAIAAFKNHRIERRGDRWWRCLRFTDKGYESTYAFEAYVLHNGSIFVGGDIESITFGYYSDSRDPLDVLRWMGNHQDVGYYVRQKANIGSGAKRADAFYPELAIDTLEGWIADLVNEDDEKRTGHLREIFAEAIDEIRGGAARETVLSRLADDPEGMQWLMDCSGDLGMAVSMPVIFAHAALAKLCELLEEEEQKTGLELVTS